MLITVMSGSLPLSLLFLTFITCSNGYVAQPTPDHGVCLTQEMVTVKTLVMECRWVKKDGFVTCLTPPYRCKVEETTCEPEYKNVTTQELKPVRRCCAGFHTGADQTCLPDPDQRFISLPSTSQPQTATKDLQGNASALGVGSVVTICMAIILFLSILVGMVLWCSCRIAKMRPDLSVRYRPDYDAPVELVPVINRSYGLKGNSEASNKPAPFVHIEQTNSNHPDQDGYETPTPLDHTYAEIPDRDYSNYAYGMGPAAPLPSYQTVTQLVNLSDEPNSFL